jgi:hypothetical protein
MEETPSELRLSMSPVHTLKELCLGEMTEEEMKRYPSFNEYRLVRQPENLITFVNLFLKADRRYDGDRLVWTSEHAFVCRWDTVYHNFPGAYRFQRFGLELSDSNGHHHFLIHSTSIEETIRCVDFLLSLEDTHFQEIEFDSIGLCEDESSKNRILEIILQQSAMRQIVFSFIDFTADHCRTLAASGTRANVYFYSCRFEDAGAAFVEVLATRGDGGSGPSKLTFCRSLPFDYENWAIFLNLLQNLESLVLSNIHLKSEKFCRTTATAQVRYLELIQCECEDGGAALVESVKEGSGPKGLRLAPWNGNELHPFDSPERLVSFMYALGGNTHLERLSLWNIRFRRSILQALAAALPGNKGLTCLELCSCDLEGDSWNKLLGALSTHPLLLALTFESISTSSDYGPIARTKAVAGMLLFNEQVEEIRGDESTFDIAKWNMDVAPKLECNVYRKRFLAIQKIGLASTRAAVVARALANVESKPSLVCLLLSQNHDILTSYLNEALRTGGDPVSTPPRKRSRSPSSMH